MSIGGSGVVSSALGLFLCFQAFQRLLLVQAECNHTCVNVCSHLSSCSDGPSGLGNFRLSPWFGAALRACSRGLRQGSTLCLLTLPCPRLFLPLGWFWCWLEHSHPHPHTDPCGQALAAHHLQGQGWPECGMDFQDLQAAL